MMLGLFADDGMNFGAGDSLDMLVSMLINVLETESQLWCLAGRYRQILKTLANSSSI